MLKTCFGLGSLRGGVNVIAITNMNIVWIAVFGIETLVIHSYYIEENKAMLNDFMQLKWSPVSDDKVLFLDCDYPTSFTFQRTKQAVQKGIKTAVDSWPGSTFPYNGISKNMPTISVPYKTTILNWEQRVTQIVDWLTNPKHDIQFVMAYFEDNNSNNNNAPVTEDSQSYAKRVKNTIKKLYEQLKKFDIDIIIMSDHGTKEVPRDHVLNINRYVPESNNYKIIASGPISFIRFNKHEDFNKKYDELLRIDSDQNGKLDNGEIFNVYKSNDDDMNQWNLYEFEYLKDTLLLTTLGDYTLYDDAKYQLLQQSNAEKVRENGYLKTNSDMNGIFLCIGPSFKKNKVFERAKIPLHEVYQITSKLLDIEDQAASKQRFGNLSKNMKRLVESVVLDGWNETPVSNEDNDYGDGN